VRRQIVSETPITDNEAIWAESGTGDDFQCVPIDVSRQLEKENAELREKVRLASGSLEKILITASEGHHQAFTTRHVKFADIFSLIVLQANGTLGSETTLRDAMNKVKETVEELKKKREVHPHDMKQRFDI